MGVSLGDILVEDDNLHGEGINIAARLGEAIEPSGAEFPWPIVASEGEPAGLSRLSDSSTRWMDASSSRRPIT